MVFILMALWVAAAIALWRHASTEGTAGWWKWLAVAVAAPLLMYVVGREVNKRLVRR
jgi:hypothetical protein